MSFTDYGTEHSSGSGEILHGAVDVISIMSDIVCPVNGAPRNIAVIGAGINGLIAANYLQRAGHRVTLLERCDRVGGACVSKAAVVGGIRQDYALGASTLGLMQDFVWQETGLAKRYLRIKKTPARAPGL